MLQDTAPYIARDISEDELRNVGQSGRVQRIRTSSELEREPPGLGTHLT